MRPATLLFFFASMTAAAAARPEPAAVRIGGVDYINLEEGAEGLGLHVERLSGPSILLKDGAQPVARLVDRSREIDLKGLRVFLGDAAIERSGVFYVSRVDYRVRIVPRLRPGSVPAPPGAPKVVVIDPGHGGTDHGAENRALGTMEKTYTLDVALRLRRLLEGAGFKVVLTRDSDVDIPLALRAEIANRAGADLFVSIHFNSLYPNTKTTGAEVLSFPPRTQRSTDSWSPGRKDDAESKDAPVNAFDAWNSILAGAVHRRVVDALRDGDRGEKLAHLGALRELKCPGVLVESAIISSDKESELLATPGFRDKIATALFEGIQDYAAAAGPAQALAAKAPAAQAPAGAPAPRSQPTRPTGP